MHEHFFQYAETQPQWKAAPKMSKKHWWSSDSPWDNFPIFDSNNLKFVCECGEAKWVKEDLNEDSRHANDN